MSATGAQTAKLKRANAPDFDLPAISRWRLRLFAAYVRSYLRRHFYRVHLLGKTSFSDLDGWPLLICLNHPAWWDPLLGLHLSQLLFHNRRHYGPIAAEGLAKYKFFERLGFFGIDPKTKAGAGRFLRIGNAVLSEPNGVFWVTAQGEFTDVRVRPLKFQAGVGHLACSSYRFAMLPLALEYAFRKERKPEAFAFFGAPIFIDHVQRRTAAEWTELFARSVERAQTSLADHVTSGSGSGAHLLLSGVAGIGGFYDRWRRLKALAYGKRFHPEHDEISSS
jgi:1-acyl-sn-glycerol-3-phosphate acyltransferase